MEPSVVRLFDTQVSNMTFERWRIAVIVTVVIMWMQFSSQG